MKWGLDIRAHGHTDGLNGQKNMVLAYWDIASGKVEEAPEIEMLLEELPGPQPLARRTNAPAGAKGKAKPEGKDDAKPETSKLDEAVKAANKQKVAQLGAGSCDQPATGRARWRRPPLGCRPLLPELRVAHRAHSL